MGIEIKPRSYPLLNDISFDKNRRIVPKIWITIFIHTGPNFLFIFIRIDYCDAGLVSSALF